MDDNLDDLTEFTLMAATYVAACFSFILLTVGSVAWIIN